MPHALFSQQVLVWFSHFLKSPQAKRLLTPFVRWSYAKLIKVGRSIFVSVLNRFKSPCGRFYGRVWECSWSWLKLRHHMGHGGMNARSVKLRFVEAVVGS